MMTLAKILDQLELPEKYAQLEVKGMALDSRQVKPGDLFIAVPGEKSDGRKFIAKAIENGGVAVLAEGEHFEVTIIDGVPVISLSGLSAKMSSLAGRFYDEPSKNIDVVGVTGTNGKSTCVALLAQASNLLGKTAWQLGTVGYGTPGKELVDTGLTTPDAISCQRILAEAAEEVSLVAMEVSSHAIVQKRVAGVSFKGGVFTNITRDHLDFHPDFESYCEAKLSFLRDYDLEFVVLNYDDKFTQKALEANVFTGTRVLTFSIGNSKADVWAEIDTLNLEGIVANLHSPWGEGEIRTTLVGEFNLSNVLAVIAVLGAMGFSLTAILAAVQQLKGVEGRLQKVDVAEFTNGNVEKAPSVFIDYAHTPDALLKAMLAISRVAAGDLWVVFGCGGDRDKGKRVLMADVASQHAQHIVVTSDNPRSENPQSIVNDIVAGLSAKVKADVLLDRKDAIEFAINKIPQNACLLIAGKGHEKYQIIGEQRLPFDDYLVAHRALQKRFGVSEAVQ